MLYFVDLTNKLYLCRHLLYMFMQLVQINSRSWLLLAFLGVITSFALAQDGALASHSDKEYILIISSYNPDISSTSSNIAAFVDEYRNGGGHGTVVIENMNCKSLMEASLWKARMKEILYKYAFERQRPTLMVLLGQEAWGAYLSQDAEYLPDIPVLGGMISRNYVAVPDSDNVIPDWNPESLDVFEKKDAYHIIGGCLYEYDIDKNIALIKRYYPDTKNIALLSDNTYGGISMQAYVRKEMKKHPEFKLLCLDGRKNTVYSMVDTIAALPENTVLLLGTWRIDKNEGYFMHNSMYVLKDANPDIPVFTLSTIGLGYWALGGYVPDYQIVGKKLAQQTLDYLNRKDYSKVSLQIMDGKYRFDIKCLENRGLDSIPLPKNVVLMNRKPSFIELYRKEVLIVSALFVGLIVILLIVSYFLLRTKRLKYALESSQAALIEAKERAEEGNRLKTAFLANMSHEIRTPLNAIVGFSNVIADKNITPEEQESFAAIIRKNSDLLLSLINDILDVSRLESGRTKFVLEPCDLVELCQSTLTTAQFARPSDLNYVFDSDLDECVLDIDMQRIQQVLINLLSNAGKFTEKGSITLSLHRDEVNKEVRVMVSDTGVGIPEEKQARVFERFEKLNEYSQGTGLGLSICKLIVEHFNGRIWVDQTYKEGARFIFTIPYDDATAKKEK